ncbi:hypothetical protein Q5P01_008714 [Channa striata]|uniref:RING-type domain-containing protein n=1 Tax=Channa striata TaxID=64152 RepID=A0AA88N2L0_CHASR|nr:hypothetical protein Q5P01_008714 [Channa striata]
MSYWICCNSCFLPPSADRKLALTNCGHVICSICFHKGRQDKCLMCKAECQVSPLSDKSSSEVKALFSDINAVTTKHLMEISKVIMFQARHQKRLLTHYRQRNEKLEEVLGRMRQEMQQMTKKMNEKSAYISKLENSLQHMSIRASSVPQMTHSSHTQHGHKPVLEIPYNSPMSPDLSTTNHAFLSDGAENMEVDERCLFRKPNCASRLSLISPPQDGRMGTILHRSSKQNTLAKHSACSATVSRFQVTPDISYGHSSGLRSPIFKPPSSFRHSVSSLVCLPP